MSNLEKAIALGQTLVRAQSAQAGSKRSIAIPSYKPGGYRVSGFRAGGFRGLGDVAAGMYTITGTNVILRAQPDASSSAVGTLTQGDTVDVLGDPVETDPAHMVGANGIAIANDGNSPGIDYVHVGTEKYGAGWVAANFLQAGAAKSAPAPSSATTDVTTTEPSTTTVPSAQPAPSKWKTFLVGGIVGVAVVGGVMLIAREMKKSKARHATA